MSSFIVITGLFFLWGVPNNLNDVLIRQFIKSFAISRFVMAIIGGAVMTPLMSLLAERLHSTALAYTLPPFG